MPDIRTEEVFDSPIDTVWTALTSGEAMATWLMANDFEPRVGHRFLLHDERARNRCEVLALEPPRCMEWAWRGNDGTAALTRVTFDLADEGGRTQLAVAHLDMPEEWAEPVRQGWVKIIGRLRLYVAGG